jgi:DNA replication protein DnaC
MVRRLKTSRLDSEPCVEGINYRYPRQLDGAQLRSLLSCQWVTQHLSVIFTGPTGIGKSWLAQALAHKACRDGFSVLYRPAGKLFRELGEARVDGSLGKLTAVAGAGGRFGSGRLRHEPAGGAGTAPVSGDLR